LQAVDDDAMQSVRPDRELAAGEVAQQAALGLVTLGDGVLVGALEGTPSSAGPRYRRPGCRIVGPSEEKRDEPSQGFSRVARRQCTGARRPLLADRSPALHAKHGDLPGRCWARLRACQRGGCGRAGAASS
jgi:hypothetical protein